MATGRKYFSFDPDFILNLANDDTFKFRRFYYTPYFDDKYTPFALSDIEPIRFINRFPSFGDGWGHTLDYQLINREWRTDVSSYMIKGPFGEKYLFENHRISQTVVTEFNGMVYDDPNETAFLSKDVLGMTANDAKLVVVVADDNYA